jgi:hypothetical protein
LLPGLHARVYFSSLLTCICTASYCCLYLLYRLQYEREAALRDFSSGTVSVLIATDVASRGLDVKGIGHVINMDLPRAFEDYVHRIGESLCRLHRACLRFVPSQQAYVRLWIGLERVCRGQLACSVNCLVCRMRLRLPPKRCALSHSSLARHKPTSWHHYPPSCPVLPCAVLCSSCPQVVRGVQAPVGLPCFPCIA